MSLRESGVPCGLRKGMGSLLLGVVWLGMGACGAWGQRVPLGWKLVWQDEFNGPELDAARWVLCERGTSDWNDTMSSDPSLLELKGGLLRLRGVVNPDPQRDPSRFLTAGVTTRGRVELKPGRVEVRARFKSARGAWPAIWMVGTGARWPDCGEIDLVEHLNFEDIAYHTVHSAYTVAAKKTRPDNNHSKSRINRDSFNVYGVEWDAERIVFFLNGVKAFTYRRDPSKGQEQWPFARPMHLILSMQIGGAWVGEPDPAHYPAHMEIDWVRVYERG